MKVALIDPSLFTPPYDIELAEGLRRQGHDVTLYGKARARAEAEAEPVAADPHFYPELVAWRADRWPRKVAQIAKGALHVRAMARLWRRLAADPPDVIHFQWMPLPLIDMLFVEPLRRVAPLILTAHDSRPFNASPGSRLQQLGATALFRRFDGVIAHTESTRDRLVGYGVDPERIVRIAHGLLHEGQVSLPIRDALDPDAPIRLLLFGKLKPYKGADILIDAVGRLTEAERARIRVEIVGKPYMDMAPLFGAAEKLGDCVRFDLRFLDADEMRGVFESVDAIVFPYREIEVSGVLMAALGARLPIVAFRIGGFDELLEDGRHALLVPPGDVDALTAAIRRLIYEPETRIAMSREVDKLIGAVPSWDEIATRTTELYEAALSARYWSRPVSAEAALPKS